MFRVTCRKRFDVHDRQQAVDGPRLLMISAITGASHTGPVAALWERNRAIVEASAFQKWVREGQPAQNVPRGVKVPSDFPLREALNKTGVVSWYETTGEL